MKTRENSDWSKWYLIPTKTKQGKPSFAIRRYRKEAGKTKWDSHPHAKWSHLRPEDLEAYVTRLNGEREAARKRAEEAYRIKHTFITQATLDEFDKHIRDTTTTDELAQAVLTKVHRRFLHFFVNVLNLTDPLDWKSEQAVWGKALMNRPESEKHRLYEDHDPRSKRVVDDTAAAANRFMRWLHDKNPRLFPLVVFEPVAKAVLKKHEAKRKMERPNRPGIGRYVNPGDWKTIEKKMKPEVFPFVWLAYHLGLRRAEALGVKIEDVRKGYFHLVRQLVGIPDEKPVYGPPKNRKDRKVEWWFTTPQEAYGVIDRLPQLVHPDTFTDHLAAEMKRLGLDYEMHDFRRTWITRALRDHPATAVRLGAGHSSIETTMRYVMDDRDMNDEPFIPEAS